MPAPVVTEFWTLAADLERHYTEPPLAFEADLVRLLRLCESHPEARPLLVVCCREILNGTRPAPQELVPFLMWRLKWPEIHDLASRLYDEIPPARQVFAGHLRKILDAYSEDPDDKDLFEEWLDAGSRQLADSG